ncbi:MAG TPA: sialidase family protein [Armatimonadota bacterium]|nr:sialidase family protein [Armatimonadota bacterium]
MTNKKLESPMPTSMELAANTSLIPVWDPTVPFPSPQDMHDLDIVTHVSIERAQPGGFHYLHKPAIAWHRDQFYLGWANHRTMQDNNHDELIRGRTSAEGLHWSEPSVWLEPPRSGADSINCPLIFSHEGELHGFFVGWHEDRPTAEMFILGENGFWQYYREACIPRFMPFCTPQPMDNGNWIIGGEYFWHEAAVAISKGDDFMQWERVKIPRPDNIELLYPETAIVNQSDRLLAFCRPYKTQTAPVSESRDGGRTWTPLALSNFPLAPSQPFAGRLSTGQNYLLTNSLEEGHSLLTIAVTGPEGGLFRRIFKVRHQQWPARRLFVDTGDGSYVGKPTEWSCPNATERDGNLYITYTQGKEDCALSIVPIEVLSV